MNTKLIFRMLWLGYIIVFLTLTGGLASADSKSYKAAINANELLVLMSACDLLAPAQSYGRDITVLKQMCDQGKTLLKLGMSAPGPEAWAWQPGKMTDHNDFKYAGNSVISNELQEKKVPGISLDSSHFYSKWPLFFLSALESSQGSEKKYFQASIDGLIANLFKNVVTKENAECVVRYKNYIDGTNGVYRWNWDDRGANFGHSEYSLSYTPFISSLALLDNSQISEHYKSILSCYPYSTAERKKYFWSRGLEEERLLVMLSTQQPLIFKNHRIRSPSVQERTYYSKYFYKKVNTKLKITSDDAYATVVGDRMLVMHYAFFMGYKAWVTDFEKYADSISKLICLTCGRNFERYDELHSLYFLSKYSKLAYQTGLGNPITTKAIYDRVVTKVEDLYSNKQLEFVSNYGWDQVLLFSYKDYVEWKIAYYVNGNK